MRRRNVAVAADITPPTGFPMMGWVRSGAPAAQHTRLWARAIVVGRGST